MKHSYINSASSVIDLNIEQIEIIPHTCKPDLRSLRIWAAVFRGLQLGFSHYTYLARSIFNIFNSLPAGVRNIADFSEKIRGRGVLFLNSIVYVKVDRSPIICIRMKTRFSRVFQRNF